VRRAGRFVPAAALRYGARVPARKQVALPPLSVERVQHVAQFRVALRHFLRQSEEVCRRWRLTPQRYFLLLVIKGAPDGSERLNFTDVAERLQLSTNSVTDLCSRAEEAGLIRREPSLEDQRVTYLRLTPEGERRLRGVVAETDRYRSEFKRGFDELTASFHAANRRR
jgi:DNA-binding MarR family transcriptional regulator